MSVTLHTNEGDLKIEVFCESVPKTAEVGIPLRIGNVDANGINANETIRQNFLALCASSYYDQSPFHRSIPNFMIQTGGPAKPTEDNPKGGQSIWKAPFEDEIRPTLKHNSRGIVSMANKGPGTNGSQFFVLFDKAPHLDGMNTVFGKLLGDESLATLAKLEAIEVDKKNRPRQRAVIERVTIHANPLAD